MAEFYKECSKKLNIKFDGFYVGEICEECGNIKTKINFKIFTFIRNLFKK